MSMFFLHPVNSKPNHRLSRLLAILLALTMLLAARPLSGSSPPAPTSPGLAPSFGVLPLSFVPNAGQTDPAVRFQAHGMGGTLFFTPDEVVLSLSVNNQEPASFASRSSSVPHALPGTARQGKCAPERPCWPAPAGQYSTGANVGQLSVVRLRFEGADPALEITGSDSLPGVVNYFIGNDPARWHTQLPTYGEIVYRDLYPGVDLHYTGATEASGRAFYLKGTYTVAPGADPTRIRWRYQGGTNVQVDEGTGDLLIKLPTPSQFSNLQSPAENRKSEIIERAPVAWQTINGQRLPVSVRYVIDTEGSIGFALGGYDPAYPMTIDPTLTYSTFLGGSRRDVGRGIAVDADGNVYVTGQTSSTDFPLQNPAQPGFGGGGFGDVFVAKLNPTGSALVYATYLGGSNDDTGYAIAVDSDGNAYVTGDSLSANFPTERAVQPASGGGGPFEGDAFIVKLDPSGSALVYATYLGGRGDELGYGIALDVSDNAYVTGYTSSVDFPTVRAAQPEPAFPEGLNVYGDAFVTQVISASGVYTWGYSTFLGGTEWDEGHSITVDASGKAYVTGNTRSTDFPTAHPIQPANGGSGGFDRGDAFVTQVISASGVYTWGYSTFLGGSGSDSGYGIALDDTGDAYVTGETASINFPTVGPLQATNAGGQDAFVTQVISASGVYTWGYSTFLGGDGADTGRGVVVDTQGNAYLTGNTRSANFPTTPDAYDGLCGTDGLCNGSSDDVFFAKLNEAGNALAYSTYLGGHSADQGRGIALDARDNVYMIGDTTSSDFPISTGAYDPSCGTDGACNGPYAPDAFVLKMAMSPDLALTKTADPLPNVPVTQGDTITYTLVTANRGDLATGLVITDVIPPGTAYVSGSVTSTLGSADFDGARVTVSLPSLAAGSTMTASFRVTVTTGFTTLLANRAVLAGEGVGPLDSNPVSHPVQGTGEIHAVYLPIVLKSGGETPPQPGCAPYLVAAIGVGDTPRGIALDTTRNRAYVANYGSGSLSVIDSHSNSVIQTVTGIAAANGVAYDPVHDLIWVTNYGSDQVTPVDAVNLVALSPVVVGNGPWGVAYDPVHDFVYVVNSLEDSVTVVHAGTRSVMDTLAGSFSQPFHVAVNRITGKAYVTNFGGPSVTVLDGASVSKVVDLSSGNPSTQPYGIAVDETRYLVYVATVDSHRVVVIGDSGGTPDQVLGWAALRRGFGDPARPVPLRAIAINPDIGPDGDGGHIWTTTSTTDGSEANQALLIPKGWDGYFSYPVAYDVGANPSEGIAVDRATDRVYVTSGTTPGTVTVLGDSTDACLIPFGVADEGFAFEVFDTQ